MKPFSTNPLEIFCSIWKNRYILKLLIYREILGRYKGSFIGIIWSLLTPICLLIVYTFVFSFIFKAKWTPINDSPTDFALILFPGLLLFNIFSECILRSPYLILNNPNYVKKILFPLEILPIVSIGCAAFHFMVGLSVWLIAYFLLIGAPHLSLLFLPIFILPTFLFTAGFIWLVASTNIFLRDLAQVIAFFVSLLMFVSPIFYPLSSVPDSFLFLYKLNPLTNQIEFIRNLLFYGKLPDLPLFISSMIYSSVFGYFGFFVFQKLRIGFSDAL